MTRQEIIETTVKHYETNPRSASDPEGNCGHYAGDCNYLGHNGELCAVGQWLRPELLSPNMEGNGVGIVDFARQHGANDIDDMLVPAARGHTTKFWEGLQMLHDINCNWTQTDDGWKLSEKGKQRVKWIMEETNE